MGVEEKEERKEEKKVEKEEEKGEEERKKKRKGYVRKRRSMYQRKSILLAEQI